MLARVLSFFTIVFIVLMPFEAARAQEATPAFRFVAVPDTDFFGSDLEAVFDTNLETCARICANRENCAGFTFNTRSNACFPKSAIGERSPYEGAFSAFKSDVSDAIRLNAAARSPGLAFLPDADLSSAHRQARDIGLRFPPAGAETGRLIETARHRAATGEMGPAVRWMGEAVAVSDAADLWADYAAYLLRMDSKQSTRQRAYAAAINSYLRGDAAGMQVNALTLMAEALEVLGRGRDMLPVLRLAEDTQPRRDVAQMLDDAIGKYGFRIADSTVESDSTAPRICVEFSEGLARSGVEYSDYVKLPDNRLAVEAEGRQLCIGGLEHGTRYSLTLRRGLPAESGEALYRDIELSHYVRDRSPAVRFPGRAYVLPRSDLAALPVETVNLSEVQLTLRRVSDRNLLRSMQEDMFARPLSQWQEEYFADAMAEDVWTGTAEVQSDLNRDMTTRLPLDQALADQPAGIYALSARIPGADPYDNPGATQWFVLSDLGLSTMRGADGLHVQVQGLTDAAPKEGVELTLISRANAVLARVASDATGYARFEPGLIRGTGGSAPALLLARQGEADLSFLSLTDAAFDLSDRGVQGRPAPGPVDVFLATDRGAYRAGEMINVTALARDGKAQAIEGLPLIAILSRPDGVEYSRLVSGGGQMGGHVFALPVGTSAPRGTWRLEIKSDPEAPALASRQILVEDFLPERIDFTQDLPAAAIRPGAVPPLTVHARYLFGAPGAGLSIDGDVRLRAAETVAGWPGYRFGRYDSRSSTQTSYFGGPETDADGFAELAIEIPTGAATGKPMEATVITRLADGSARPVERRLTVPVQPETPVIGIKPLFEDVAAEGTEAAFEVIGLSPMLEVQPMQLRWTLNRVETRYQWYQQWGNWNWEPITRRRRVATGETAFDGTPVQIANPVEWGRYELVVERLDGERAEAAVDFYAGWYAPADSAATPNRLELSLDAENYQPGDTSQLRNRADLGGVQSVDRTQSGGSHCGRKPDPAGGDGRLGQRRLCNGDGDPPARGGCRPCSGPGPWACPCRRHPTRPAA